jgi:hypothetical protein
MVLLPMRFRPKRGQLRARLLRMPPFSLRRLQCCDFDSMISVPTWQQNVEVSSMIMSHVPHKAYLFFFYQLVAYVSICSPYPYSFNFHIPSALRSIDINPKVESSMKIRVSTSNTTANREDGYMLLGTIFLKNIQLNMRLTFQGGNFRPSFFFSGSHFVSDTPHLPSDKFRQSFSAPYLPNISSCEGCALKTRLGLALYPVHLPANDVSTIL